MPGLVPRVLVHAGVLTEPLHTFNTADHVGSLQDVLSRLVPLVGLLLILQGLLERVDQLLELFAPGLQLLPQTAKLLRGDHGLLLLRLQGLDLLSLQLGAVLISLSWGPTSSRD